MQCLSLEVFFPSFVESFDIMTNSLLLYPSKDRVFLFQQSKDPSSVKKMLAEAVCKCFIDSPEQ